MIILYLPPAYRSNKNFQIPALSYSSINGAVDMGAGGKHGKRQA